MSNEPNSPLRTLGEAYDESRFEPSPFGKKEVPPKPADDEAIYDELDFSEAVALYYGEGRAEDKTKARRWLNFAKWVNDYFTVNKDEEGSTAAVYGWGLKMVYLPEEYTREEILEVMREAASRKDGEASDDARQWLEYYYDPNEREWLFERR